MMSLSSCGGHYSEQYNMYIYEVYDRGNKSVSYYYLTTYDNSYLYTVSSLPLNSLDGIDWNTSRSSPLPSNNRFWIEELDNKIEVVIQDSPKYGPSIKQVLTP